MLHNLKGWLPVDAVVVDGRPGLWWMEMPDVSLAEPFFQQTVERAKSDSSARGETFTEFDVLLQLEKQLESVPPTGFIFHSSRCGSTLVANACRAITNSIVLSEANAIDKLIARFFTDAADGGVKDSLYSVFLRGVVHALGQRRNGSEQHLFIKFACTSFAQIERIKRIWPRVPWVFLYRDPIETIVSNVTNPPTWLLDEDWRVLASIIGVNPNDVAAMSLEERCARSIGSLYSQACALANDESMLLNYNQLSVPVLSSVLEFFKVSPAIEELEAITRTSGVYAKELSGTRPFVADADAKQKLASDLVRELSARWANEPYQRLEEKRQ
ncbi:MAG TPA: hypothetical protein VHS05_31980 [Pyrinomonadaceae bacterium]|jgi:hypothetical protein|nr:hypothetical protein [Pyrinomonadaceae bacterium]